MANYVAAILIVAAVALFVAAPLSAGFRRRRGTSSRELERERLEHLRGLAVQGLRELEFDHEMGKLEESDYLELKRALEGRALAAMSGLERLRPAVPSAPAVSGSTTVVPITFSFCPQCGTRVGAGHRFCMSCGTGLAAAPRAAAQGK